MESTEQELADCIARSGETGEAVQTRLTTNERVLARITDGIYRQPASALRELISNAYDADATEVVILTDAPRFSSIIVRDDGLGLSPTTLAHMLRNIGGSAKRTQEGKDLEITAPEDATRSPGGRQLIGKLGIGLFAVAQFTRHFLIVSKRRGDPYRTVADITLGPVNDEQRLLTYDHRIEPEIETGHAQIYREHASEQDLESQGTEIRLLDLLPRTRAELASHDLWAKIDYEIDHEGSAISEAPALHIGRISPKNPGELLSPPVVPWQEEDLPETKFSKLVDRVRGLADSYRDRVDLESVCDRYLQTIWTLALSAPLPYLGGLHPFDLSGNDGLLYFKLENSTRGQAVQLKPEGATTLRAGQKLVTPDTKPGDHFRVEIDGIQLSRPIWFKNQPTTSAAVKTPMMFIGQCRENFKSKPTELSGGPLSFEAYLLWAPKVTPTQHQGVVIRVGNASGTVFDSTFMGYQISEQTRLRQITAEIFVREGFDGAINLDRESYNFAHPHYQFVVKWLHSALRQLTNRHKEVGKQIREDRLKSEGTKDRADLEKKVNEILEARGVEDLPEVILLAPKDKHKSAEYRRKGVISLMKDAVVPPTSAQRHTTADAQRIALAEKKAIAVAQILETWGLLKGLTFSEQERLVREILEVTLFGGNE